MTVHYSDESVQLHHGDCLDVLRGLPDNSVDSVVCDPPYGLANTTPEQVADTLVRCIAIEREADYLPLIEARIERAERPAAPVVPHSIARPEGNGRDGEASAERRYADRGGSNFAMKPGRRYDRPRPAPMPLVDGDMALFDFEEPA